MPYSVGKPKTVFDTQATGVVFCCPKPRVHVLPSFFIPCSLCIYDVALERCYLRGIGIHSADNL